MWNEISTSFSGIKRIQHDKNHNESALVKEIQAILDSYSNDNKQDENHENDDEALSYVNRHLNCIQ